MGHPVPGKELLLALTGVPVSQQQIVENGGYMEGKMQPHLVLVDPMTALDTFCAEIQISVDFISG